MLLSWTWSHVWVSERNYSTVEKEALALVASVRAFSTHYGAAPVSAWTDHSPLRCIETMNNSPMEVDPPAGSAEQVSE